MIIKGAKVFDTEEGFKAGDIQYVDGVITAEEEKRETGEAGNPQQ